MGHNAAALPRSTWTRRTIRRPPVLVATWIGCLVATVTHPLAAQDPTDKGYKIDRDGDEMTMSVDAQRGLPLWDFIKITEQITGRVFTHSKQDIQRADSNIFFTGTVKLKKSQFFAFFQTMLYIHDFACVIRGEDGTELVDIIHLRSSKQGDISGDARYVPADDVKNYRGQTGVQILTSIPLQHLRADRAVQHLNTFLGQRGGLRLGTAGDQTSVLLQGFAPRVHQACRLLELVDLPANVSRIVTESIRLEHASVEEMETLLKRVFEGKPPAAATGTEQPAPVRIFALIAANRLILSGTRDQINEVRDLIAQLDRPLEEAEGDTHVIRLQNTLAKDLYETLKLYLQAEASAEQVRSARGGATPPRRPVLGYHKESNTLLLSAPPSKFAQLRRMIESLDERPRQVLIECAVVELGTIDLKRFGIELGLLDTKDSGNSTRPFGFSHFGQSVFEDTDDNGLPDTRLPDFDNPLSGFTGGILTGGDFAIPVLINALEEDNKANVLSKPSIMVNDNMDATVTARESRPTQKLETNVNSSVQGFDGFEDAGITLKISPSISSNNYLRLNLTLTVSRFITAFDPNSASPGVITHREIQTQVTLPSGHTMVIGGIIEDQESTTESGVPFLKDIPLLGWLFKKRAVEKKKTNLYVFLTPYILDENDFSDLDRMSTRKKLEAEHYIGTRRMELVDPKWGTHKSVPLDGAASTVDDLDDRFGFQFPNYRRPPRFDPARTRPVGPDDPNDRPVLEPGSVPRTQRRVKKK